MASTKEMMARAAARKRVNTMAQNAAKRAGMPGIDMTGADDFMDSVADLMTATTANSSERMARARALFIAEALKHGGQQAAAEMEQLLAQVK